MLRSTAASPAPIAILSNRSSILFNFFPDVAEFLLNFAIAHDEKAGVTEKQSQMSLSITYCPIKPNHPPARER